MFALADPGVAPEKHCSPSFLPFPQTFPFFSILDFPFFRLTFPILHFCLDPGAAPGQQCSPGFSPFPRTFPFYIFRSPPRSATQRHTATPTRIFKFPTKNISSSTISTFYPELKKRLFSKLSAFAQIGPFF